MIASSRPRQIQLWLRFAILTGVVSLVSDGWSGKPGPLIHQLLLLPAACAFTAVLWGLLRSDGGMTRATEKSVPLLPSSYFWILGTFEALALLMMAEESRHFAQFGYHLSKASFGFTIVVSGFCWWFFIIRRGAVRLLVAVLATYAAGLCLAIRVFPLNYLRSDMLPVIGWADSRLVQHLNPYTTMHVGSRLYDFPYLPGMLVSFLPVVKMGLDLRVATLAYLSGAVILVFSTARAEARSQIAALLGVFLLCPFLQYRHDLYLQPHWFALTLAVVLMQRKRFFWSAIVWGASCAIYQLSWVMFPFLILNAYRRGGVREAAKSAVLGLLGFLVIAGAFLRVASRQVASNTVGQWSHLPHALADPINVSYWLTYVVRPDVLRWVQAAVLTVLFVGCWVRGRCSTLLDTLRWMACALAIFIPLNVLVDGYFYLTLLWVVLLYVCVASGWWASPETAEQMTVSSYTPPAPVASR